MASLRAKVAFGFRAREAHTTRFLIALFAVVSFATAMVPTDARAQFVCDVPNPSAASVVCTNSGPAGGVFLSSSTAGGNATAINSGTAISTAADAVLNGNATAINTSAGFTGFLGAFSESGIALSQNFGTAFGILSETTVGGAAIVNNAGIVDFLASHTTAGGDAISVNSGTVANTSGLNLTVPGFPFPSGLLAWADSATGKAISINSGTANGDGFSPAILTVSDGGDATATNFGTAAGIYNISGYNGGNGNATIINYGIVTAGIVANSGYNGGDGNADVFNAGSVFGGVAAFADGFGTATVSNSGLVDGTNAAGGVAIALHNIFNPLGATTLNILPGSRIVGFINLNGDVFFPGTGTQVNILSGRDISSVLSFGGGCGCAFGGLLDTGSVVNVTGGAPYVINGNTVAILDPTSFSLQDRNVVDVTRTISSLVTGRLTNPAPVGGGTTAIGFAPTSNVATDMARDAFAGISSLGYAAQDRVLFGNPSMTAPDGTSIWAQGFGGRRMQSAYAPTLRSVNNFYGGALGVDKAVRPGLRLGGFIGAGSVKSTVDLSSGDTTSDMVFGGVYGRYAMSNAFIDFGLLGGHSRNDVRRTIANNLAPGGYEYAAANYNGWFISPEIAYGVQRTIAPNWTLTPTARVRYLAASFAGYQETGSTTNLTVASRISHNFEERGEVTLAHTTYATPKERLILTGTLGALALQRVGDTTVNTVLLGQNLAFATPGKDHVFGLYTGGGFDWRHSTGVSVFGAAEFTAMTDSSRTLTGKGGVKYAF